MAFVKAVLALTALGVAVTIFLIVRDPPQRHIAAPTLIPIAAAHTAVEIADDSPSPGFRTVVFFVRDGQYSPLVNALRDWDYLKQPDAKSPPDVVVVLPHPPPGDHDTPVGGDPTGAIARAYGIPVSDDGGPPVGYAIVDASMRIRYATVDPNSAGALPLIATLLDAVR